MPEENIPVTQAVRVLREKNIGFRPFIYRYREHGGTRQFADEFGIPHHSVIKTLVFEDEEKRPLIVLMHGDCEVSARQLARSVGVKQISLCDADSAQKHTGYQFGGTSPFGTRRPIPVYAERTLFDLPGIYINGGKRGFIIGIDPSDIKKVLDVTEVDAAVHV
jgi:Cys-tRNA(Pro) deacylase